MKSCRHRPEGPVTRLQQPGGSGPHVASGPREALSPGAEHAGGDGSRAQPGASNLGLNNGPHTSPQTHSTWKAEVLEH